MHERSLSSQGVERRFRGSLASPAATVPAVRRPRLALLALLLVVVVLSAPTSASAAPVAAPTCSKAAARKAIRATKATRPLRATLDSPYGAVAQLICRDLTHDGVRDMTVSITGGGTADITGWAIFRAVGRRWRPVLVRPDGVHFRIRLTRADEVWEQYPVYRVEDAGCCPTGGFENRRFRWGRTRFTVARHWHTEDPV